MPADLESTAPYDAEYYASHCGTVPYQRNGFWLGVFANVADQLIRAFAPHRVFDAGCALGMLVESFWDRGVEAHGRDISEFAIGSVRPDMRPYCSVGSVAAPIEGTYDLLTCIEVLEHMPAEEAEEAVRAMARAAPRILFSSSPTDFAEPTHINVRPTSYWLRLWAEAGFAPNVHHDAGYLAPHAFVLERTEEGRSPRDLIAFTDRIRHRVAMAAIGARAAELQTALTASSERTTALQSVLDDKEQALTTLATAKQALMTANQEIAGQHQQAVSAVRHLRQELGRAQARIADGHGHLADVQAAIEQNARAFAEAQVEAASRLAHVRDEAAAEIDGLRRIARHSDAEVQAIRRSTSWRVTAPLRKILALVPGGLTRSARVGLRYTKSIALLRVGTQFRSDRLARQQAAQVAASPLFDAPWYLNRYPDVAIARLDPAVHYSLRGEAEGREASAEFSALLYAERHPEARGSGLMLLHATRQGRHDAGRVAPPLDPISAALVAPAAARLPAKIDAVPDVDTLLHERFRELRALPVFAAPQAAKRLSIVTDSINAGSLYGGVGTAIVLAALTAQRIGATLRIVTRTEPPVMANIGALLGVQGIEWDGNVDFVHAPADGSILGVPAGPGDLFLTTSWWTTWATRLAVPRARMAYLLQEDERMFYPLGDDHLRCTETLRDPELLYLVNSELLLGYLQSAGLAPGGTAFEPSFPEGTYHPPKSAESDNGKRRFFFYARPMNPRNLYWRGLEALSGAIESGALDPDKWDFYFAGKAAHDVRLPGGVRPHLLDSLSWSDYAAEIRQMDLGLSLMYTPHPSYPPLDLAACGAVVVTSRFGPKQSLDRYCANIICAEPDLPSLVSALGEGARLADDRPRRAANYAGAGLQREWSRSAAPAIDRLAAWAERAGT